MATSDFDKKKVLDLDPWLEPFIPAIEKRYNIFERWRNDIERHEGGYDKFTRGFEKMGFNVRSDGSVIYREWAPLAKEATLIGDFSQCRLSLTLACPLTHRR